MMKKMFTLANYCSCLALGSMAEKAIAHLQKIVDVASHGQSMEDSFCTDAPPPAKRRCNRLQSLPCAALQSSIKSEDGQCLECEVKDAEIQTLRRKINALQEQIRAAAVRLEVMETKSSTTCKSESRSPPEMNTSNKPSATVVSLLKVSMPIQIPVYPEV